MSSALAMAPLPTEENAADRRREPRLQISIAVRQEVNGQVFLCQAGNINTGGMFLVRAEDERRCGSDRCWLEFSLPGAPSLIRVRAQVIWEMSFAPYELQAVRFMVLAPSHRREIQHYLAGEPYAPRHPAWDAGVHR